MYVRRLPVLEPEVPGRAVDLHSLALAEAYPRCQQRAFVYVCYS